MTKVDVDSICSALCKAVLNTEIIDPVVNKEYQKTTDLLIDKIVRNNVNKVHNVIIMEPCVNPKVSSKLKSFRYIYKQHGYILIQGNGKLKSNQNLIATYKIRDAHFDSLTLFLIPDKVVMT